MADEHRRKRYREWAKSPFGTMPFPEECRGMSTGAKTPEGKARQLEGYRRWQEKRRQTTSKTE